WILLLVLIFLVIRYRMRSKRSKAPPSIDSITAQPNPSPEIAADTGPEDATRPENVSEPISDMTSASVAPEPKQQVVVPAERFRDTLPGFIFSGVLLGLLPMWNSAVFIAAFAVLAVLFVVCSLRVQMVALAIAAGLIALPQMLYLSTGPARAVMPRLLHWGYMVDQPTAANVAKYLGFTFGFKWLLIALALVLATGLQRRIFVAVSSLLLVAFSF